MRIATYYFERSAVIDRALFAICILLAVGSCQIAAQTKPSHTVSEIAASAHFAAAQEAQENKAYDTSEREYKAVLAIKPGFAEVHMNLGLVYQLEHRISDAMMEFRRALALKPGLTGANFFLGVDHCNLGEGNKAIPYLQAAVRQAPNRPDIRSWLATAQEMSGDIHAEVATLREALSLQPKDVDLLYLLGNAYERLGKEEVRSMQKAAPGSARGEQLLAESYAAGNEWPTAVLHYQNAFAALPDIPGLHVELGEVLLRAGRTTAAAREFEKELRLHPGNLRATARRGEVELVLGDVEAALLDLQHAMDKDEPQVERILGIRENRFGDNAFVQLPDALRKQIAGLAPELQRRDTPASHLVLALLAAQNGDAYGAVKESPLPISSDAKRPSAGSCSEAEVRRSLSQEHLSDVRRCRVQPLTLRSRTDFRIKIAGALFEAGDYDDSLDALSGLASAEQHLPGASYWRARCYVRLATAAYLSLSEVGPNSYRVHQLMGDLEAAKGNDGKAIEEYRLAIALKPSLPNLHYSLGHLLWKDLKVKEAREELEAELGLNPRHGGALNELGDTYLLEHQPNIALPYLTRALSVDPKNPDIHRDLGTAYSELRDYQRAEAQFKIALSDDNDGSVHYKLARVYQAMGKKERAAHEFEVSTTLNRESHSKLEKQTERLAAIEKSTQAVDENESLTEALSGSSLRPSTQVAPSGQFASALAFLSAGKYESAVVQARSCIDQSDAAGSKADIAQAWSLVGIAQSHLGDPDMAVNAFHQAATLAPKQEEHWLNLTRELMELSRYDEAISAVQEGIASNPDSYALHLRLGAADMAAGRYAEAEAAFRTLVLAGDPLPTSYIGLAQVLLRSGRAADAVSELTAAKQELGTSFLVSYFLGLSLDRAGRRSEAIAAFRDAIRVNPSSPEAHLGLGKTMLALGQAKDAIVELDEAVQLNTHDLQARRLLSQAYRRVGDTEHAASYADESGEVSPAPEAPSLGDFILPQWHMSPESKKN